MLGLVPDWLIPLRRDLPLLRAVMSEMALTDRFYALLNELEQAGYEKRDITQLDALFTGMEMDKQGVVEWGGLKEKPHEKGIKMLFEGLAFLGPRVGVDNRKEHLHACLCNQVNILQALFDDEEEEKEEKEEDEEDE